MLPQSMNNVASINQYVRRESTLLTINNSSINKHLPGTQINQHLRKSTNISANQLFPQINQYPVLPQINQYPVLPQINQYFLKSTNTVASTGKLYR
jgi:hypothetical protein